MSQASAKDWISAFRLRTLPLSLSSIVLGSFLALYYGGFDALTCTMAILTTLFLQILSNLANDYGDFQNGADNEGRVGPQRMVQAGKITPAQMKRAVIIFGILSFVTGFALIALNFEKIGWNGLLVFLGLGIASIFAAYKYTAGKNPYGYQGLGDLFVFIFFGIIGVAGTYYLHIGSFNWTVILPAVAIGALSTGVLNLNNMRDRINDAVTGKITMAVRLGAKGAKGYHIFLLSLAILSGVAFIWILNPQPLKGLLFLGATPLILLNLVKVIKTQNPQELDPELKKLAISTLLYALLLGIGINL